MVGVSAAVLTAASDAGLGGYRAGLWFVISVATAVTVLAGVTTLRHRRMA